MDIQSLVVLHSFHMEITFEVLQKLLIFWVPQLAGKQHSSVRTGQGFQSVSQVVKSFFNVNDVSPNDVIKLFGEC